jgi:hypothetical protein
MRLLRGVSGVLAGVFAFLLLSVHAASTIVPLPSVPEFILEEIQPQFAWSGELPVGQTLSLEEVVGTLRTEASRGTAVEVLAFVRSGAAQDTLEFDVAHHAGGVRIHSTFAQSADTPSRTSRAGGPAVDWVVRLPVGVRFIARNAAGEIIARRD